MEVARVKPSAPIIRIYAHEIGKIFAEPNGAPLIGPGPLFGPAVSSNG